LSTAADGPHLLEPYRHQGAWVFDDPTIGLRREPFVTGIDEMIDRLVSGIPDAARGFRLWFAPFPFEGCQAKLRWVRADPVEGNWYRTEDGAEGWLCPALLHYLPAAPAEIYVRAEARLVS
jgi:hypothetical protein